MSRTITASDYRNWLQLPKPNGGGVNNTSVPQYFNTINGMLFSRQEEWEITDAMEREPGREIIRLLPDRILNKDQKAHRNKFISYLNWLNNNNNQHVEMAELAIHDEGFQNQEEQKTMNNISLNTILFGPPGTGKTYNSIAYAVAICDGEEKLAENGLIIDKYGNPQIDSGDDNFKKAKNRYEQLKEEGRIGFVTFHQSYGYEEFIEGIKPIIDDDGEGEIGYCVESGIFKDFCHRKVKAPSSTSGKNFDEAYNALIAKLKDDFYSEENPYKLKTSSNEAEFGICCNRNENLKLMTGSEFKRAGDLTKDRIYETYCGQSQDFFRGYYSGVVKELEKNFQLMPFDATSSDKNKVFIIDEINRGNISKIFGELITLIEESKRVGNDEGMEVVLPYSKKSFGVPKNVYILGTMNTADRSIALMDTALRRRFDFVEMMPQPEVLRNIVVDRINVEEMLKAINDRVEVLYDREHTIGHAFFTKLLKLENPSVNDLAEIFRNKVIPLLQEYFYEDYEKIQMVLGDAFVELKKQLSWISNKKPDDSELQKRYIIKIPVNPGAYTKIYETSTNVQTAENAPAEGESEENSANDANPNEQ